MRNYVVKNDLEFIREVIFGWSTMELARKSGVRRQAIEEIETGKRMPEYPAMFFISRALGIRVDDIFWVEEKKKKKYKG